MKGLELARAFYTFCRPKLVQRIPDLLEQAAVGLVGEGSECFGTDDELSQDHDFGPAFCLWFPQSLLDTEGARIEAAISELPPDWENLPSRLVPERRAGRTGPISIEAFYTHFLGQAQAPERLEQWLGIPEFQLASVTNGEVFEDPQGRFSAIRAKLLMHYPEELWRTKLAARCMQMAQAGQYNLSRAIARRDTIAALFSQARFSEAALSFVYLINRRYMPFYKQAGRLAASLPLLGSDIHALLTSFAQHPLLTEDFTDEWDPVEAIESFAEKCVLFLTENGLSRARGTWLWDHGPSLMESVHDPLLRRQNLLAL